MQYPGIATAVRADVQNLGLLLRLAKTLAPGMDPKAMAEEIRERLTEELDYEIEAQTHRAFARTWRGHPFVVIPEVVTELSGERVLVTEYMDGMGFDEVKELPDAERDRFGEIVYRFFLGSLYRTRRFSADPHPGNYLLLDDGRVAFIDFGMSKRVSVEQVDAELKVMQAGIDRDARAPAHGARATWASSTPTIRSSPRSACRSTSRLPRAGTRSTASSRSTGTTYAR